MSDFEPRKRHKTLLIVEGNHEKDKLFKLLLECFPEMHINYDDIWIYGTNIYVLYNDIVKEYDEDWNSVDIDLPWLISKKVMPDNIQYKRDYTNIYLVFDYERHDTYFSEDKICRLQEYFSDSSDVGQLYINYPMIESYQDALNLSEDLYMEHKISVTMRPGNVYKNTVKDSPITQVINWSARIDSILKERSKTMDNHVIELCREQILSLKDESKYVEDVKGILASIIDMKYANTLAHMFLKDAQNFGYITTGEDYWSYLKRLFKKIIQVQIGKAHRIITNNKSDADCSTKYNVIDFGKILSKQNDLSRDDVFGYIWVLNTSILLVPEYNTKLICD